MRKIVTADEAYKWCKNKKIRIWRRALYIVWEIGPLTLYEISGILDADPSGTERALKKMGIDHWVRRVNHKWEITDIGDKKVRNDQKFGSIITRAWGEYYQ